MTAALTLCSDGPLERPALHVCPSMLPHGHFQKLFRCHFSVPCGVICSCMKDCAAFTESGVHGRVLYHKRPGFRPAFGSLADLSHPSCPVDTPARSTARIAQHACRSRAPVVVDRNKAASSRAARRGESSTCDSAPWTTNSVQVMLYLFYYNLIDET